MFKLNIFTPPKINFPLKPVFRTYNNLKFINRMPVQTNNGKIVYIESMPNLGLGNSETLITNRWFNLLGNHNYDMFPSMGTLEGFTMDVYKKHQHNGLGEILRLTSIIEMKENGLEEIKLFSLPKALLFHLKYGFKPVLVNFDKIENFRLKNILKGIVADSRTAGSLNKTASEILADINNSGGVTKNHCIQVTELIIKYAEMNRHRWTKTPLTTQIPLVMTNKEINENAGFFNNLFQKHGLDYRI